MTNVHEHYSVQYTKNYIDGNVYAITGATSGFGKETVLEILKMGGKVVVNGRRQEAVDKVMEEIAAMGKADCAVAVVGTVADYEVSKKIVATAVEKFGKLDAFVANAGTMPLATFHHHDEALSAWENCIDVNLKGNLYGICASYDQFKAQGYGHFVTVSSIHGNFPTAGGGVYAATKVGIRYLAHALMNECHGLIKVSVVRPTGVAGTGLMATVVNGEGSDGIFGSNRARTIANRAALADGSRPEFGDPEDIGYIGLKTEELVWGIMFALNQPRGVNAGDITMHATNEDHIL